MVEMALLLPLMLMLIFGIIDFGWYVYAYSSVYQAARNGSEVAAQLPPFEDTLNDTATQALDPCYQTILNEAQKQVPMFNILNGVTITYPNDALNVKRDVGNPIQVSVQYNLELLTPLTRMIGIGNNGRVTITSSSVRSIEALGYTPISAANLNGIICKQPT
jgi:Flp pilus assembly protein TadG